MLDRRWGTVTEIVAERPGAVEVRVAFPEAPEESGPALAYPDLTGPVAPGDRVLVNTTAVRLRLGTGGLHFVIAVDRPSPSPEAPHPGHLMKLRYTPLQHSVGAVEEGPLAARLEAAAGLEGMPVVAAELHSQLAAVAAGIRVAAPEAAVAYVMPDTAALPLAFSRLVPRLRAAGLIRWAITCGQAFGGDVDAVSLPSALAAAKEMGAAAAIVAQGPGNAGTGTRLGFSGIAQADWLNAAHALGGTPIAAVRLSFADPRPRHRGVSHHTLTVLGTLCLCRAVVPLPSLPPDEAEPLGTDLAPLAHRHQMETYDGAPALALLERLGIAVTTMGRSMAEERAFFLAAGAAGIAAGSRLGHRVVG